MKLIFLVSDLHLWGGGERVAVLMANHYAAKSTEVTLLSVGKPGGVLLFEIDPAVKVEYLSIPLASGWKLFRKMEAIISVRSYFRKQGNKPDKNRPVILLGMGNFPMILAAMVPKSNQLRRIGCPHSPYKSISHIWRLLRWLFYRRLEVLVSLTKRDVPRLKRLHPDVRVIPNPVSFYPDQAAKLEGRLILAIGRFDQPKGYDLMMEVFERFCKKNNDWQLKIIGDGPSRPEIEKIAHMKGMADRVTISPATGQIVQEYLAASIFLMTSRSEGLPMVLLEAQACGLPIVAYDCETGPAEMVHHGEDGYLVPLYHSQEMCERLHELASDGNLRKAFGAKARENVKRFLPDKIFGAWDELFRTLI